MTPIAWARIVYFVLGVLVSVVAVYFFVDRGGMIVPAGFADAVFRSDFSSNSSSDFADKPGGAVSNLSKERMRTLAGANSPPSSAGEPPSGTSRTSQFTIRLGRSFQISNVVIVLP